MPGLPNTSVPLLARYLVVGGLNTAFGYGVIALGMALLAMPPLMANAAGFVVGYTFSFLMHRRFTFRSSVGVSSGMAAYLPVVAAGYAANACVLLVSTEALGLNAYLAQALAIATYVVLTFIASSKFVFRKGESQ